VGSIRCEMLDHVIPLNEQHLMRLSHEYIQYYDHDRTHIGLNKQTPGARSIESQTGLSEQSVGRAENRRPASPILLVSSSVSAWSELLATLARSFFSPNPEATHAEFYFGTGSMPYICSRTDFGSAT